MELREDHERCVLAKGLNFAVAPKDIPFKEVRCGVEAALKELPEPDAEELRGQAYLQDVKIG